MMNTRKFLALFLAGAFFITSCSDDDDDNPDPVNEEEVITTMTVTLTDGSETVTLNFFDPDGDGPAMPQQSVDGDLKTNRTYNGTILLLNATEDPAEVVNEEIEEEADEHQFFYLTDDLGITTAYSDTEADYADDGGSNPVGISFTLTTTDQTGDGELQVILLHELDKDAEGVAEGNDDNAGGEPDIDLTFDIEVKE